MTLFAIWTRRRHMLSLGGEYSAAKGIHHPKTALRIMKKYELLAGICRPRKCLKVGQQAHEYKNLLSRNVCSEVFNRRWDARRLHLHRGQGFQYTSWSYLNLTKE